MTAWQEIKEDFNRWWVTATFQEKISLCVMAAIVLQSILLPLAALLGSASGGGPE